MKHGQCPKDLNPSTIDHSLIHIFTFFKNEKNQELSSSPHISQKIPESSCFYIQNISVDQVW